MSEIVFCTATGVPIGKIGAANWGSWETLDLPKAHKMVGFEALLDENGYLRGVAFLSIELTDA